MPAFSLTNVSNLFKIKYGKLSENVYNSANVVLGRVKKSLRFHGTTEIHSDSTELLWRRWFWISPDR